MLTISLLSCLASLAEQMCGWLPFERADEVQLEQWDQLGSGASTAIQWCLSMVVGGGAVEEMVCTRWWIFALMWGGVYTRDGEGERGNWRRRWMLPAGNSFFSYF